MIRGRSLIAGIAAAAALIAVVVAPAVAAATLAVSPPSGVPGQVLRAIGIGFSADQQIKLQWDAGFLPETGTSDSSGAFDIPFAIPSAAAFGGHVLRACIRGVCSQAVPFTVSVVAATAPPIATPVASATVPSATATVPSAAATVPTATGATSAAPEPSNQTAEPSPGVTPSSSTVPSGAPSPAASATGVIVAPTVVPTALPSDPNAPGTIKVQFAWDRIAIAAALGLGVLLIFLAAANEKSQTGSGGMFFGKRTYPTDPAGEDAPGGGGFAPSLMVRRNAEKGSAVRTSEALRGGGQGHSRARSAGEQGAEGNVTRA